MDTEFHYWVTALIAHRAGFPREQARVIAHACELVDHNGVSVTVRDPRGEPSFVSSTSQTLDILKPRRELMRIYPVFHFLPGNPEAPEARRRDGHMHRLNTTPGGPASHDLLTAALRADEPTRLYRIGIAAHAFEDTWAHQNFVGWYDPFNHLGIDPKPNIGHADAEHHPDWMSHLWFDDRLLEPRVNNRMRFLQAARSLFDRLRESPAPSHAEGPAPNHAEGPAPNHAEGPDWPALEAELVRVMGPTWSGPELRYRELRERRYRDALPWLEPFEARAWFDAAIDTSVRGLTDSHEGWPRALTLFEDRYTWRDDVEPEETDWLRFQQAIKDHETAAVARLQPIFSEMGIDLSRA